MPQAKRLAERMPEEVDRGILEGLRKAILIAEQGAKVRAPVETGHLRRSIRSAVEANNLAWVGSDVIYARIQELGGTILPRRGKYLRFQIGTRWVTVPYVTIQGKHYLERGITENQGRIADTIRNSIIKEIDR